jgi:prepilin-type processing-associated H-X9-DG protein
MHRFLRLLALDRLAVCVTLVADSHKPLATLIRDFAMIRFVCTCGQQLQAREENAGKVVLCPACQQRVTVPDQPSTSVQPEEPREPAPARRSVQHERPALSDEDELESKTEDRPRRRAMGGSSGKAIASLVLGIVSFCGCSCLTGLPAILLGILSLRDIGRAAGLLTGKPMAFIGIVLGSLGTLCLPPGYYFGLMKFKEGVQEGIGSIQQAAQRQQSINNLKQMALAMQNYNAMYTSFPSSGIGDPLKPEAQRKPNLSWRVAILPLIEEIQLYQQFKFDEPWDGPNNIKLLAKMPKLYKLPGDDKTKPDHTHYQVFVGNGAAFEKTRGYKIPGDFPDGLSNTILIVEAENAVPWTKPDDVPFDPSKPIVPLLSTYFNSGCNVALADGSVKTLKRSISETTLKNAIRRNDGQPLGADWSNR